MSEETETSSSHDEEDGHKGTFVLLMLYLVGIAAMWVWVYWLLLERG